MAYDTRLLQVSNCELPFELYSTVCCKSFVSCLMLEHEQKSNTQKVR